LLIINVFFFYQNTLSHNSHSPLDGSNKRVSEQLDDLLKRFAVLDAETVRLKKLGLHIAKQTHVNVEAYDLTRKPALGGVEGVTIAPHTESLEEISLLESINASEKKLANIQKALNKSKTNQSLSKKRTNYLAPVENGYISSNYGMRTDPINGKHRYHKGVDIAGKQGTLINTIASGFVTFVGKKGGYGNVVEIHHSDALKSRYAHIETILVEKGKVVRKGELIATMGSTGRVTGPHLHLEVWKNGKAENPSNYLDLVLGSKK